MTHLSLMAYYTCCRHGAITDSVDPDDDDGWRSRAGFSRGMEGL